MKISSPAIAPAARRRVKLSSVGLTIDQAEGSSTVATPSRTRDTPIAAVFSAGKSAGKSVCAAVAVNGPAERVLSARVIR